MMTKKQFIESQKECAAILGMTLNEYQEYCENIKISLITKEDNVEEPSNTYQVLESLGLDSSMLKTRKD